MFSLNLTWHEWDDKVIHTLHVRCSRISYGSYVEDSFDGPEITDDLRFVISWKFGDGFGRTASEKRMLRLLSETVVFAWEKSKCCGARHVNLNLVQYSELVFTLINVINIVMFLYPDVIFFALSREHLDAATRTLGQISLRQKQGSDDQWPVQIENFSYSFLLTSNNFQQMERRPGGQPFHTSFCSSCAQSRTWTMWTRD